MSHVVTTPAKRWRADHPMQTIFAEVSAVSPLTPTMNRITFTGPDFARFITDFPDQFVTLIFPLPHQQAPAVTPGFTWEEFQRLSDDIRPVVRNYTVRRYRPERQEIDIDMLLHGEHGFGTRWAARAKPGDRVGMWGSRVGFNPPPDTTRYWLVGDETGLPAIGAILESLPAFAQATVIIEVEHPFSRQPLVSDAEFDEIWLCRDDSPDRFSRLLETVRSLPPVSPGDLYAWGGGEIELITAYGRLLRRERGLKTAAISAIGYWRPGEPHS